MYIRCEWGVQKMVVLTFIHYFELQFEMSCRNWNLKAEGWTAPKWPMYLTNVLMKWKCFFFFGSESHWPKKIRVFRGSSENLVCTFRPSHNNHLQRYLNFPIVNLWSCKSLVFPNKKLTSFMHYESKTIQKFRNYPETHYLE